MSSSLSGLPRFTISLPLLIPIMILVFVGFSRKTFFLPFYFCANSQYFNRTTSSGILRMNITNAISRLCSSRSVYSSVLLVLMLFFYFSNYFYEVHVNVRILQVNSFINVCHLCLFVDAFVNGQEKKSRTFLPFDCFELLNRLLGDAGLWSGTYFLSAFYQHTDTHFVYGSE